MKRILRSLALICAALAGIAGPLQGQMLNHDVSAGPQFSAGRITAVTPVAAHCIATRSQQMAQALAARTLVSLRHGQPVPPAAQATVWNVITGEGQPAELAAPLAAGGGDRAAANALAQSMRGLTARPRIDRINTAIGHYNRLLTTSSQEFRAAPPAELDAVHTVLLEISCMQPVEREIPPPVMRTICVLTPDNVVLYIAAEFRPETGDTLVGGRPFREAYPIDPAVYAAAHDWFRLGQPIRFDDRDYRPWGRSRTDPPAWRLRRVGEFQGVPIFVDRDAVRDAEDGYSLIYLPLAPRCEFQPYQPVPRFGPPG